MTTTIVGFGGIEHVRMAHPYRIEWNDEGMVIAFGDGTSSTDAEEIDGIIADITSRHDMSTLAGARKAYRELHGKAGVCAFIGLEIRKGEWDDVRKPSFKRGTRARRG